MDEGIGAGQAPAGRIGNGTGGHGSSSSIFHGIATVPAHPHLVIVTCYGSHQVRVYDISSGRLLTKMGKADGSRGTAEGEFKNPWGVVVTADSAHIIVAEESGNRLQLLRLIVSGNGGTRAELAFVRSIGDGQLQNPRGLALRSVGGGGQTVLVAEYGGHQVSEWALDGSKIRTIGTGRAGAAMVS